MINTILDIIRLLNDGNIVPMQKDEDTKIDLYNEKVQLFMDASGEESKYYYFSELEINDENQDNLAEIEDVALNSDAYTVIEKPTPSDSYMILFWKVECIEERMYPDIIKIEENEFFYKKYVFYYTEKELQCFEKWCRSLKTNGKPMLDTVLEAVQFLNDESEQVQFLTRLLSKVPFFNPIFPKAVMNDFDEMVKQKIDGIRKQKQNVEMLNDMFIRSIEEGEYWKESAKMLAGMIHLMRGTPYIYQGEEIGMTNPHYTSIEQYADVESRNYYEILLNEGKTKEEALEILAARSRDNSRTPMQWTDERYCGFSDTKPWIPVSDNFEKINVKKQKQDRDSILEFYKKLIMLRKEKEVIARGNIEFMEVENAGVLAYTRCLDKQKLLVCCNFRDVESQMEFTQEWKSGRKILGNYEENHKNNYKVLTLRPYEIIVLEKGEE